MEACPDTSYWTILFTALIFFVAGRYSETITNQARGILKTRGKGDSEYNSLNEPADQESN